MSRYRARPTVPAEVEARQFTDEADAEDLAEWCEGFSYTGRLHGHTHPPWQMHTCITLTEVREADSRGDALVGDWIVKHADGFEVLSSEEFTAGYEAAGDAR
jgi:hypothetical protein